MNIEEVKFLIGKNVSHFLKDARQQMGLSVDAAASRLGYDSSQKLHEYEKGYSIPCCELMRVSEQYRVPNERVANFLTDLQIEVHKLRRKN